MLGEAISSVNQFSYSSLLMQRRDSGLLEYQLLYHKISQVRWISYLQTIRIRYGAASKAVEACIAWSTGVVETQTSTVSAQFTLETICSGVAVFNVSIGAWIKKRLFICSLFIYQIILPFLFFTNKQMQFIKFKCQQY